MPHDLDHSPYQSDASAPITLIGFGGVIQPNDVDVPGGFTVHRYSYFDLSTYQDTNEKGNYSGSFLIRYTTDRFPEDAQIDEYRATSATIQIPTANAKYIPVLVNNIFMTRRGPVVISILFWWAPLKSQALMAAHWQKTGYFVILMR